MSESQECCPRLARVGRLAWRAMTGCPDGALKVLVAVFCLGISNAACSVESTCFGTVNDGRIENSVPLPGNGPNFTAYSSLASTLGRTHVHSRVARIVSAAYRALEQTAPAKVFVYGETGWPSGGRFRPHRSHRNGLSVDFFVPVVDGAGRSVPLPTAASKTFGYDIEFDREGKYGSYRIDFEALAEHLYQLDLAAKAQGAGMALVIFDPPYLRKLFVTQRGAYLKAQLNFMKSKAWVRHDEHYHVNFAVVCQPLGERRTGS